MTEIMERLLEASSPKEFSGRMKEAQNHFSAPADFVEAVAGYLPTRLYENYYGDSVPRGFFGIMAATEAQTILPAETGWRPYVQQTWSAARERKRTPWNLDKIDARNQESLEKRWHHFTQAAASADVPASLAWAKGFLASPSDRDYFRAQGLSYALADTAHGGFKFLYLIQAWKLAQSLQWKNLEAILFPALHYLVAGPREKQLSARVREYWQANPLTAALKNSGTVSEEFRARFEQTCLFGESIEEALDAVGRLGQSGASVEAIRDVLLLTAAQAVANSRTGHWPDPARALNFVYFLRDWANLVEPHRRTFALLLGTALIHRASTKSSEGGQNRVLDQLPGHLLPTDATKVLRSVVSHSDPYASATAAKVILDRNSEDGAGLATTLMDLAVKNDGHVCGGDDILLVKVAADCHQASSAADRSRFLVATAFFLGRIPKSYELFGAYGF